MTTCRNWKCTRYKKASLRRVNPKGKSMRRYKCKRCGWMISI